MEMNMSSIQCHFITKLIRFGIQGYIFCKGKEYHPFQALIMLRRLVRIPALVHRNNKIKFSFKAIFKFFNSALAPPHGICINAIFPTPFISPFRRHNLPFLIYRKQSEKITIWMTKLYLNSLNPYAFSLS